MVLPSDQRHGVDAVKENIMNDLVATQATAKFGRKDGVQTLRAHSSVMTRMVGTKKEEFARIKRHHEAFRSAWDTKLMEPEDRVCLLLNRFTRNLVVMYASSACERVLHIDPDVITGKPILLFIRSDDLESFVTQMDTVKKTSSIVSMRFWFQSPNVPQELPCEAVFIGAVDAILVLIRRYKSYTRKKFIVSQEQYESNQRQDYRRTPSFNSSSVSSQSSLPCDQRNNSQSPRYKLSRSALNRVKIYELSDVEKVKPLACIPNNDPHLVRDNTAATQLPEFREMIIQNYDNDDSSEEYDAHIDDNEDVDDYGDDNNYDTKDNNEFDETNLEYIDIRGDDDIDMDI
ncbi:hypothetical protein BGZ46_002236 [Entomortierella lignicola]|nr:hypothetical protein BGZ46_002236 [Entomortierella lignicola]